MKWEILDKSKKRKLTSQEIIFSILKNRGFKKEKEIEEFLNPIDPVNINLLDLGVKKDQLKIVQERLNKAKKNKEKIIIFGDYDCDGVCSTAILWEGLYKLGFDVLPYIPDRFSEGYGLKVSSFKNLQEKGFIPKLIITVDNGIVAYDAINEAKKRGIDVIVVDHHTLGDKKNNAYGIIHSVKVCGSALAWFLLKEILKDNKTPGLDLAVVGTIADQMPLLDVNRSIVKYGLEKLEKSKRPGIKALLSTSGISKVGVYEIGFLLAPRINAMGRLTHALDSLRLLCTKDAKKANSLANVLNDTNIQRQTIVEEVLKETQKQIQKDTKIIVIDGNYHEGVIGLASGKITEKLYKPSIVFSRQDKISKASARSISGFNIINAIKETGLILEGGGHPMAAGFSIETEKIEEFKLKINELNKDKLTDEVLEKKLKIDTNINFSEITNDLVLSLQKFEPVGYGNFAPIFVSKEVKIEEIKPVGSDGKHLKLKLSQQNKSFDAIWFGYTKQENIKTNKLCSIAYTVETNTWNGRSQIQLKIRDIKV